MEHSGSFPFNPKFGQFRLVHQMERAIFLVRPEYSGPALNMVNFDRSGYFGRSDRSVSFHLTKCCPHYHSFVSCYKNNNETRGRLGRVYATGMYRSTGHVKFPKLQSRIFVEWKAPPVANDELPTSEIRGIGTSFRRNDFLDFLGGQGLLMIG